MPVSMVCESPTADVSSSIRNTISVGLNSSLNSNNGDSNIQKQFVASAKRALLNKIEYEEVNNFSNAMNDMLKTKYIVLKPPTTTPTTNASTATTSSSVTNGKLFDEKKSKSDDGKSELPKPKVVLFARENVQVGWKSSNRKWHVGAGMINVGNTCYLNSALQALFHVPAFANWLVSDAKHRETCEDKLGIQNGCIICAMAKTLIASQQANAQTIKPYLVYSKLRLVCKHLVPGQQEDAHEFIRYLMEAMEKAYLARFPRHAQFEQYSKETTPINQILGGYLKSSVRCLACGHVSVTFQHFEDILLDIRKANTMDEALDLYFSRERLEDMGYKCESCKRKVAATKQFSLERAPISLCIQLKRFSIVGNKLNKHITIRQQLNLSKYASRKDNVQNLNYRLVSMVTHLGVSQHCGHYTAIGVTDAGGYYQFDDSCVRPISLQNVLHTNAYIMFYELETSPNRTTSTSDGIRAKNNGNENDSWLTPKSSNATETLSRISTPASTVTSDASTPSKPFIGPLLPTGSIRYVENNDKMSTTENKRDEKTASPSNREETKSKLKINRLESPKMANVDRRSISPMTNKNTVKTETIKSDTVKINSIKRQCENGSESDSDSSSSSKRNKQQTFKPKPIIVNISSPLKRSQPPLSTVTVSESFRNKQEKLVPYDDDSDNDSGTESPESQVNTKAGPFQVTSNTTSIRRESPNLKPNDSLEHKNHVRARSETPEKKTQTILFVNGNKRHGSELSNGSGGAPVNKLMKFNNRGYGAAVVTWNGQPSNLEKEISFANSTSNNDNFFDFSQSSRILVHIPQVKNDKKLEEKRQALDSNDAEIDRGHKKKINGKNVIQGRVNPGYNPFQEHQNNQHKFINDNSINHKRNTIYRQNPHKNRFKNGNKNGFKQKRFSM